MLAGQHVNAPESEIGAAGLQYGGDETVAAADVEHAGTRRSKLGKPSRKDFYPAVKNQVFVQDSDRTHGICSVQREQARESPESIQSRSEMSGTKRTGSRCEIKGWPLSMRMN